MIGSRWVRQAPRWMSIVFTAVYVAIFIALGLRNQLAQWIYFLPLLLLAALTLSGLSRFFLPYLTRRRVQRNSDLPGARQS